MSTLETSIALATVDYFSVNSEDGQRTIEETPAASAFRRHMEQMQLIEQRLDEAYAGALLFNLLVDHPWLVSCRVAVWGTPEYDDQGGTFVSASARVHDVVIDAALALGDENLLDDAGAASEDIAEDLLTQCLWDDEQALLDAVNWATGTEGASTEYSIHVDRSAVASLLANAGHISGHAVFAALLVMSNNG